MLPVENTRDSKCTFCSYGGANNYVCKTRAARACLFSGFSLANRGIDLSNHKYLFISKVRKH